MKNNRGFTLIEVLIALVIVGMALPALLLRMQDMLADTSYIQDKTYAYWLAENKMQEVLIKQKIQGDATKTKKDQDSEEFAGQEWYWKIEFLDTEVPQIKRMEVSVGLEEDAPLVTLAGFMHEPQ